MLLRFVSVSELIRGQVSITMKIGYISCMCRHHLNAHYKSSIEGNPYKQEGSDRIALMRWPVRAFSVCMHNQYPANYRAPCSVI